MAMSQDDVRKAFNTVDVEEELPEGVKLADFVAYMPTHSYIYNLTREMWPAASVNSRIDPITIVDEDGKPILDNSKKIQTIPANQWIDKNNPVEQMTWAPGEPMLIKGRLIANGGWVYKQGVTCFNQYKPPNAIEGDPSKAGRWVRHARQLYSDDADHIIRYFAFKVRNPQVKINHALLIGGPPGIGKDTLIEPLKYAVGHWNFNEVSPQQVCGRFNGHIKSVILRINEIRDLGEGSRFDFYEHLKTLTASPPDVLRCDEKHIREYSVANVCGVIITTNYKMNGIYLPAEDRRHFVAWSDAKKEDFEGEYWNDFWRWYDEGGIGHVIAYLNTIDISDFDPKAPPLKTAAFWAIVDANRSPEESELADAIDLLGRKQYDQEGNILLGTDGEPVIDRPKIVTLSQISMVAAVGTKQWLDDRKSQRIIPHRMEECGYEPVRNDAAKDGLWKIGGKRQAVYGLRDLSIRERIEAIDQLRGQGSQ
jgi:hypothetical protein